MRRILTLAVLLAGGLAPAAGRKATTTEPPGKETTSGTEALGLGAKVLQPSGPITTFDIYLVGFHPMKDDPSMQMEAHHFCHQVNEDFTQCVLFDGNTKEANLNGVEYIISEQLFERLPEEEKQYWHPHNFEILSGQLVAPGIPASAEKALMRKKMNSYGKTWHFWMTDAKGRSAHSMPLGPPHLAWSFNRDGEAAPGMVEERDRALGISTQEERQERADLAKLAHPQRGVDDLKGAFPKAGGTLAGVTSKGPSGGVPVCTLRPGRGGRGGSGQSR